MLAYKQTYQYTRKLRQSKFIVYLSLELKFSRPPDKRFLKGTHPLSEKNVDRNNLFSCTYMAPNNLSIFSIQREPELHLVNPRKGARGAGSRYRTGRRSDLKGLHISSCRLHIPQEFVTLPCRRFQRINSTGSQFIGMPRNV